jgi:DNA-binding transcriptional LysR family regulator
MTEAVADPVDQGVEEARQRLERLGFELQEDVRNQAADLALRTLGERAPDASHRAQSLFAEHLIIASAMRQIYNEPPLEPEEVGEFLAASQRFFNSYWHLDK